MKILITVQDNNVAPRFDQATEVIIVEYDGERRIAPPRTIILPHRSAEDLSDLIVKEGIDCLICGGIEERNYQFLSWKKVRIIDFVIGDIATVLNNFLAGTLHPGDIIPLERGDLSL